MRIPATIDMHAWRNVGFETLLAFQENGLPLNLTGLTGAAITADVRVQPNQTGASLRTSSLVTGIIIVNATQGLIGWNIANAQLSTFPTPDPFKPTQYYYDITITPLTGLPFVVCQGSFWTYPGVTR